MTDDFLHIRWTIQSFKKNCIDCFELTVHYAVLCTEYYAAFSAAEVNFVRKRQKLPRWAALYIDQCSPTFFSHSSFPRTLSEICSYSRKRLKLMKSRLMSCNQRASCRSPAAYSSAHSTCQKYQQGSWPWHHYSATDQIFHRRTPEGCRKVRQI